MSPIEKCFLILEKSTGTHENIYVKTHCGVKFCPELYRVKSSRLEKVDKVKRDSVMTPKKMYRHPNTESQDTSLH